METPVTLEIFETDPYQKSCEAVVTLVNSEKHCFCVDQTVFYPMGGGQPGDIGVGFYENDEEFAIVDTKRDYKTGLIQHFVASDAPLPPVGENLYLELDWPRRYRHMRMHSCLHLLCAVIPSRVTGGQIYDNRARLDFDVTNPLDKGQITLGLNLLVDNNSERRTFTVSKEELDNDCDFVESLSVPVPKGVDSVKLVNFEGIDIQPCGGTHVANTKEIGKVRIKKIENKGKHNRRITVVFDD